jgi:hypothetical protein
VPTNGWQIVQNADGLTVLLSSVRGSFSDDNLIGQLQQALATQDVVVPTVTVQRVSAIPKGAGGKAPLIKSNVNHVSLASH